MSVFHRFRNWYIPERMKAGILRYIEHGIVPGSFLTAVIQNNLKEAMMYADDENLENLPAYVDYFYNECPLACWGSPKTMEEWAKTKKEERENKGTSDQTS